MLSRNVENLAPIATKLCFSDISTIGKLSAFKMDYLCGHIDFDWLCGETYTEQFSSQIKMNRRILRKSIRNNNVRHQEQGLKTRTLKDQKQSEKRGQRQQQQTRRGIKKQREHEDKTTKLTVTRSCGSKQLVTNQRKDTKVTKVAKLTKSAKRKKKLSKRSLAQSGGGHVRKKRQTKRIASLNASAKVTINF